MCTRPSDEAAYTKRPLGSTTGVAVVICADPATELYELGVNIHSLAPVRGLRARVRP